MAKDGRGGGTTPRRLTGRAFVDLAVWSTGFGAVIGAVFPLFAVALGVPSHNAFAPLFVTASLAAGVLVGLANHRIAMIVVGSRLDHMARSMAAVRHRLEEATLTGDWVACDPESCRIEVDSADAVGMVGDAFNALLVSLADMRRLDALSLKLSECLKSDLDFETRVRQVIELTRVEAGAVSGAMEMGEAAAGAELSESGRQRVAVPLVESDPSFGRLVFEFGDMWSSAAAAVAMAARHLGVAAQAEREQRELRHSAHHDPLTGLANRVLFTQALTRSIRELPEGRSLAVMFCDLDRFKPVNDTMGHDAGDALLVEVADRMRQVVRGDDLVARMGGDEFAVLVAGLEGPDHAREVADAIVRRVSHPVVLPKGEASISLSVGVVVVDDPRHDPAEVIARADEVMYVAKASGRGQHRIVGAGAL
ncbi:MAG TPA: GGDEF domain-containing protein [Acidimicrobiales bacterium]|nr:GGDEF domain-containing protein [Acidimicrobiales bacterium]